MKAIAARLVAALPAFVAVVETSAVADGASVRAPAGRLEVSG